MQAEDAPPGFWPWPGERDAYVDGVEIESAVATRFFQTPDRYPEKWGRINWRVQLNRLESDRITTPRFRTFYSGVEWNLRNPGGRWFLTAWVQWTGPGPDGAEPGIARPVRIEGDTILFGIGPLFLRSRVDARDRRAVAEALSSRDRVEPSVPGLIVLDDVLH
jgi:hypothetical protein